MSQENVETVRRFAVTMASGDYDAAVREFHADAKWHNTRAFPGPTICSGPVEIKGFWKALFEDFQPGHMEIEQTAETGNTVVVGVHSRTQGKASGAPVDVRWAMKFRFQGSMIIRVDVYGSYGRALEAAGLAEQDAHADS